MKYFSVGGLIIFWIGSISFAVYAAKRIVSIKNQNRLSYFRLLDRTNNCRLEVVGQLLIPLCFLLVFGSFISRLILPLLKDGEPPNLPHATDKAEQVPPSEQSPPEEEKDDERGSSGSEPRTIGPLKAYAPVTVKDHQGKRTQFFLYVFSREYHWKKGMNLVESNGGIRSEKEMIDYLSNIHGEMRTYDAVVCVGSASFDGADHREEQRALERASELMIWLRPAFKQVEHKSPDLFYINLGHYRKPPDRNEQRLVIVFGIKRKDNAANILELMSPENSEELKQQLESKKFPFQFSDYTRFDVLPAS